MNAKMFVRFLFIAMVMIAIACDENPADNGGPNPTNEERILFTRNVNREVCQLCTMNPDSGDLEIIAETEYGYNNNGFMEARWSPDKSKIVIVGGPESTRDIFPLWLIDMRGNFLCKLSKNGYGPVWRTNDEIIYNKPRGLTIDTKKDICRINIDTREESLIYEPSDTLSFSITDIRQSDKMAIGYYWSTSLNSLLAKFSVENITDYTIISYVDTYLSFKPRLSPENIQIIFAQGIYKKNNLYLLELGSNAVTNITKNMGEYRSLAWSPDGERVVYSKRSSDEENYDIYLLDVTTTTRINLTSSFGDNISGTVRDWR